MKNNILLLTLALIIFLTGCKEVEVESKDADVIKEEKALEKEVKEEKEVQQQVQEEKIEAIVLPEKRETTTVESTLEREKVDMENGYYTLTVEQENYIGLMEEIVKFHSETLDNITVSLVEATNNYVVDKDEKHLEMLESSYEDVERTLDALYKMTNVGFVPKIFNQMHMYLIETFENLGESKEYFIEGIKHLDGETIAQANHFLDKSNESAMKLSSEYNQIMSKYQR